VRDQFALAAEVLLGIKLVACPLCRRAGALIADRFLRESLTADQVRRFEADAPSARTGSDLRAESAERWEAVD
jgi:hypothetical protein